MQLVCGMPTIHFKPVENKRRSTKGIFLHIFLLNVQTEWWECINTSIFFLLLQESTLHLVTTIQIDLVAVVELPSL